LRKEAIEIVKKPDQPLLSSQTDADLWSEIRLGSEDAWRGLVQRHANLVYGVCSYVGLTQADSADCFQQTWMLLYQNRHRIKDASRLSSWLVTTAKREAIRLHRRSNNGPNDINLGAVDPNPMPEARMLQLERQGQLEIALGQMEPMCRRLLDAFFFADDKKSYRDIAKSLGYSPNTLGAKRRRCLDKLKRILVQNAYWDERK
jgi:RNA polymerase sigma factor (sigma-70 family)